MQIIFGEMSVQVIWPVFPTLTTSGGKRPDLTVESLGSRLTLPWVRYVNWRSSWLVCFLIYRMWGLPVIPLLISFLCSWKENQREKWGNNQPFLKEETVLREIWKKMHISDLQLFALVSTLTHKCSITKGYFLVTAEANVGRILLI